MTSVCSSPLGAWLAQTWPMAELACQEHDAAYAWGGTSNACRIFGGAPWHWRQVGEDEAGEAVAITEAAQTA